MLNQNEIKALVITGALIAFGVLSGFISYHLTGDSAYRAATEWQLEKNIRAAGALAVYYLDT